MQKTIASAVVILLTLSCGAPHTPSVLPDAHGNAAPIKEVATVENANKIHLEPFESVNHLFKNAKSQLPTGVRLAVLDSADWSAIWRRIEGSSSTTPPPAVDFSREMLLVVGMGQAPCMGYQINIDTVFHDRGDGERIYAVVREREHGARCGCLSEVVSPVDIIKVPKTLRPVTFIERKETNVCEYH